MLEKLKVFLKLVLIVIIILYALFQHTQGPVVAYVEFQVPTHISTCIEEK